MNSPYRVISFKDGSITKAEYKANEWLIKNPQCKPINVSISNTYVAGFKLTILYRILGGK